MLETFYHVVRVIMLIWLRYEDDIRVVKMVFTCHGGDGAAKICRLFDHNAYV